MFSSAGMAIAVNFKDLKVGVERASVYASLFEAKLPEAEVVFYDTSEALYIDLQNGRTDMLMTNPDEGASQIYQTGKWRGRRPGRTCHPDQGRDAVLTFGVSRRSPTGRRVGCARQFNGNIKRQGVRRIGVAGVLQH
ncbi:hypothetical protein [Candidatus Spongiihabitans sp.]|uniref:hypothetical protein n=1 Tax=Candidatus Spongiihabitans sp. TaxID=3101308 RepID=UPI003C6FE545